MMRTWLRPLLLITLSTGLLPTTALADDAQGVDLVAGEKVFMANCMACHGIKADGNGPAAVSLNPKPADFTSADFWATRTLDQVKATIKTGKPGTPMMPFAQLSTGDLDNLGAFLYSKRTP